MPRVTRSNYIAAFRAADMADPGVPGPKFSDEIQLTAEVEDFKPYTRTYLAGGVFKNNVSALHGAVSIEILAPGGAILFVVSEITLAATQLSSCRFTPDQLDYAPVPAERTHNWEFVSGATPLSRITSGYVPITEATGALFRSDQPFLQGTPGIYLNFGGFLAFVLANANRDLLFSWYMVELHRTSGQPLVTY